MEIKYILIFCVILALNPLKKYQNLEQQQQKSSSDPTLIRTQISSVGGGTSNSNESGEAFKGNIYGLVYNRFHIFDLITQRDPRARIYGDLRLISDSEAQQKQLVFFSLFFINEHTRLPYCLLTLSQSIIRSLRVLI